MEEGPRELGQRLPGGRDFEGERRTPEEFAVEQAERERSFQIARYEQSILNRSTRKEAIRWATREVLERYEAVTSKSPPLEDRYGSLNIYHAMRSRAAALEAGTDPELVDYLKLGEDGLVGHRFKPLETDPSLTREERKKEAERLLKEHEKLTEAETEARDRLIEELERAADEMEVREKFDDLWGLYLFVQGNLKEFRRIPFAAENRLPIARDFETLFTLPATAEAGWEVPRAHKERLEGHMGERIDLGIRLLTVAAMSERKEELLKLMESPGWRDFVVPALKKALERNRQNEVLKNLVQRYGENPVKVFVGEVDKWRSETGRLKDGPETEAERKRNRGLLTMHGNIFARKERRDQQLAVDEVITRILGGDRAAQEIARRVFYLTGLAPYYGAERDKTEYDNQGRIKKQEIDREGAPFSDARERAMDLDAFMRYKQAGGEWGGPDIAYGKYPQRLLIDLFRHISITDPDIEEKISTRPNLSEKEKDEMISWETFRSSRSLWELMWEGWDGKKALRLGEVPWDRATSYFWKDYTIRLVFASQLFDTLTGDPEAWDLRNFTNVRWWREYATAVRVCLGNWVATDGLNREWFENNKDKIDAKIVELKSETKKEKRPLTEEGWREKATKKVLDEQRDAIIYKTNAALVEAIKWWYKGNIESRPIKEWAKRQAVFDNIDLMRRRAGVLLPGEKPEGFG